MRVSGDPTLECTSAPHAGRIDHMTIFRKTVVTLLVLTTLTIAAGLLASLATAQTPRTTSPVEQLPITTSTLVTVAPGETFETGGVRVPPCPKATSFMATAVQAAPFLPTFGGNVVSLPKWAVSVHVFQVTYNGSFSPRLTAFADGPRAGLHLHPRRAATLDGRRQQRRGSLVGQRSGGEYTVHGPRHRLLRGAVRNPRLARN